MGAGLVLDVFVTFMWRSVARALARIKTTYWKRENGIVLSADVSPAYSLGCPLVKVMYRPEQGGGLGEAVSKIPFLFQSRAEDYLQSLSPKDLIVIRTNPKNRTQTAFFISDQVR